jgi:phosphomannomutase
MPDNGIKLFSRGGGKLDDAIEAAIEKRMGEPWTSDQQVATLGALPSIKAQALAT